MFGLRVLLEESLYKYAKHFKSAMTGLAFLQYRKQVEVP